MLNMEHRINEVMQDHRMSQREDLRALAMYLLGTSIFVGFTALVILLCNNCTKATSVKDFFSGSISFWGALVSASAVMILWGIVFFVFRYYIRQLLGDPTLALVRTAARLEGEPEGAPNGLVPKMQAAVESMQEGLTTFARLAETESLAKQHVIAYSKNPQDALNKLVDELVKDNNDINSVRIVATMRGVFGDNTYELGKYIGEYLNRRIAAKKSTLKDIRILAPCDLTPPATEPNNRLYPICARYFALQVILQALPAYKSLSPADRRRDLPLVISLSFTGNDIFPAWQLWGNRRLVILPSLGYEDYDKLSEALPIAVMARGDHPIDLAITFTRLTRHFDQMCESGTGAGADQWQLTSDLEIKAKSVRQEITGRVADDAAITTYYSNWPRLSTPAETLLTEKEATGLCECFGKMALIIT